MGKTAAERVQLEARMEGVSSCVKRTTCSSFINH
jgi:hypothetical protein